MQKRDLSTNKLPKIAQTEETLSSKLYSLTGLRIFQAKFMEELRYPRQHLKQNQISQSNNQNLIQITPKKGTLIEDKFTGKDRNNQIRIERPRENEWVGKKQQLCIKSKQNQKIRVLNGRPKGLRNLGNTCYINAILQSLLALEQFNHSLDREIKMKKSEKGLAASYAKLANEYRNCNEKTIINPSEFKYHMGRKKDRFAGNSQQDAQQLLTAFLQGINEEMTRVKNKPKYKELEGDPSKSSIKAISEEWWSYCKLRDDSIICDYFQGQLQSTIVCSNCKYKSVSFDNFWGLPISFGKRNGHSNKLQNLLADSFMFQSRLQGYSCQKCKKADGCSKSSKIFRLPTILIVQLKRFGYGWSKKQKIKDKVEVPIEFSVKEVMSSQSFQQNNLYKLKSTVQHAGQLNFGHYTGHVFSQKDQKWFYADDEGIRKQEVQIDSPELYLLFYYRK